MLLLWGGRPRGGGVEVMGWIEEVESRRDAGRLVCRAREPSGGAPPRGGEEVGHADGRGGVGATAQIERATLDGPLELNPAQLRAPRHRREVLGVRLDDETGVGEARAAPEAGHPVRDEAS